MRILIFLISGINLKNYTKRLRKARENGKRTWSWNCRNVFRDWKAAGRIALYISPIIDKKWK